MVADLTSARASLFHSIKLHSTPVVPLDLYAELMLEALQQVTPGASHMQLQHMTSVSVTHHQQLLVKLAGTTLSIQHQAHEAGTHNMCAQATVAGTAAGHQAADESYLHISALASILMTQPAAEAAALRAAAAAALSKGWNQDQGFCLPDAVITAAAQLHASLSSAIGLPTAAACVSTRSIQPTEPLVLACSATGASHLDAELGCSRRVACQLRGVTLVTPHEGLSLATGLSLHTSQEVHMLYELQWKAARPALQAATHLPRACLLQSSKGFDPVQACAAVMASAQRILQTKGYQLNLQPGTGPDGAIALALLRSVAQEATMLSCSACLGAPRNVVSSADAASRQAALDIAAPVRKATDGLMYEPSLVPARQTSEASLSTEAADSCVILGGTGSIGSLAATGMVDRGAKEVIMVGRTGKLSPSSAANFSTLLAQQAKDSPCAIMISIARCDTACEEESSWLYNQARNAKKLILHAGGVLADATVGKQSLAGIRQAFAAKVDAAQQAHRSTACHPTAGVVLFSSVASVLGSAGQANYSAANGALDGLAAQWAHQGRGVSAVQWGPWAGKSSALGWIVTHAPPFPVSTPLQPPPHSALVPPRPRTPPPPAPPTPQHLLLTPPPPLTQLI